MSIPLSEMPSMSLQAVKPEDVTNAYTGKIGRCCCGCSGKHYTPDTDLRGVKSVLKRIQAQPTDKVFVVSSFGEQIVIYTDIGKRSLVLHVKKTA